MKQSRPALEAAQAARLSWIRAHAPSMDEKSHPEEVEITPVAGPLDASIRVPGSKSVANRAIILAALAAGRSVIDGVPAGDDTRRMIEALRTLGFSLATGRAAHRITIDGRGGSIPARGGEIFAGGAGTVMRFLTAMLTLGEGRYRIDGDPRMRERPIGPLLDALQRLGASVYSERGNHCPPIVVDAPSEPFAGGETEIDARVSSQFVSAMLMPAPLWKHGLKLRIAGETARPFIEMTLRMMESWGAHSSSEGNVIAVPGGQAYRARRYAVEPDASSASYFAAAAALIGGTVKLEGFTRDSVQGDLGFLEVLAKMGARVTWHPSSVEVTGTGRLQGVEVAMNAMPDLVPTLAAIAPFASSPTTIRNVGFIRHHESDRLRALATELHRLGASVDEHEDGLEIRPSKLHPATIETYDDHRIAMSFAVTGLKLPGVRIENPACVAKTFPDFFDRLVAMAYRLAP
ncbi:MAG: 3-phosphoshikimate 1-carboxyvinyltransferase [Candidatus Binataceae bacterium]